MTKYYLVECLVIIKVNQIQSVIELNNVYYTPKHPVIYNKKWTNPINIKSNNFLLKGKVSFRQYFNTESEREISQLSENNIFGMSDIIYDRKRKLSCIALEECSYLCFNKDIFKLYMEENVNKVISERKRFLFKFYQDYLPISPVKIDHYISNATENLFFRKNDVIYKEGNKNISLFLIFKGEANLAININKNEFDVLPNFKLSAKKLKENARKIEFSQIIDNCKNEMTKLGGENNLNTLDLNDYKIISTLGKGNICGMEISSGLTLSLRFSEIR